ncbi:putative n-acetylglutamate synthase [Mycobacterium ulcerans str. Harvey]|uniref:N-acetylglutamate synthase n=1 Tax=Mycobacterium ulcerans str. Harvey TaxID=1299332 RepID=A0ABN0QU02_MYCUL|nr:putative n-acetylglutamate synthase [Mycobacterium ulcerans str. Harvey]
MTESQQDFRPVVRRARTSDVPAIKKLVDTYAGKILLEKNLVTLYEAVQEFWVAEHPEIQGNVIGCGPCTCCGRTSVRSAPSRWIPL